MKRKLNFEIFTDPLVLTALAVQLLLLIYVLATGYWKGGDTLNYLVYSPPMCRDLPLGVGTKPPFYFWFMCILAPNSVITSGSAKVFLPLLVQSLFIWAMGVWFYAHVRSKLIAAFWFFDPVILVYGVTIMMDAFFSGVALGAGVALFQLVQTKGADKFAWKKYAVLLGLFMGIAAIFRSNGFIIFIFIAPTLLALGLLAKLKWKPIALALAVTVAVMSPVLVWNYTKFKIVGTSSQGIDWIETVAAVVEVHPKNISTIDAEQKWTEEGARHPQQHRARKKLLEKWPTTLLLSLKGTARTLFGHINVEWGRLITGESVKGPGWLGPSESRQAPKVSGWLFVPWVLGIFAVLAWCGFAYGSVLYNAWLAPKRIDLLFVCCVFLALAFAVSPLVFGDSRFRTGVWPWVLLAWALSARSAKRSNS